MRIKVMLAALLKGCRYGFAGVALLCLSSAAIAEDANVRAAQVLASGDLEGAKEILVETLSSGAQSREFANLQTLAAHQALIAYRTALGQLEPLPDPVLELPSDRVEVEGTAAPPGTPVAEPTPAPAPVDAAAMAVAARWAQTWGERDAATQLSLYTSDYRGQQKNAVDWRLLRSGMLTQLPDVTISAQLQQQWTLDESRVLAVVRVEFLSEAGMQSTQSLLQIAKKGARWWIVDESTLR